MGSHKPTLDVGGRPLVVRVLAAAGPHPALVVGPGQGVPAGGPVLMARVPGGGPVSGLAYAVEAVCAGVPRAARPDAVVVLAADLPFVTPGHVERLVSALASADLAVTVGPEGRTNWLCAAWRTDALRRRLADIGEVGDAYGRSMRDLCDGVPRALVDDPDLVATDVDTPDDLDRARDRAQRAARDLPDAPPSPR